MEEIGNFCERIMWGLHCEALFPGMMISEEKTAGRWAEWCGGFESGECEEEEGSED